MIGVIYCGIGNIKSVLNAIEYLDISYDVIDKANNLSSYEMLILPGVGSFDSGVKALKENYMFEPIQESVLKGQKIFGICLGMQLLCRESEEGTESGLGLLDANVKHLKNISCLGKVPHVGFNSISSSDDDIFLKSMLDNDYYFVHSYGVKINSGFIKVARSDYEGAKIVSAYRSDNIFGTQFHPEKSGLKGLELISKAYEC
jgi:glutamine amidotransferase